MPTVTVNLSDLMNLIGKKIPDPELQTVLPLIKLEVEEWGREDIKLEATPDRPDLFSIEGIARQIKAWLGLETGLPAFPVSEPTITMDSTNIKLRPFIVCAAVRGVKITDDFVRSIMQSQELLDLTIGRDRRKAATGIYDLSKLTPPFHYKEVLPESTAFTPLDTDEKMNLAQILKKHPKGIKYAHLVSHAAKYPLIVDETNQVLSFPPIINCDSSRVTEKTKDLFIEITGTDRSAVNNILNILVTSLAARGGKIESVKVNRSLTPNLRPRKISVRIEDIKSLLGLNLKTSEIKALLERMNYSVEHRKENIDVYIPPFRADILHHVDVIEDVAIAYGYNDFTPQVPKLPSVGKPDDFEEFSNRVRELLIGLNFQEVMNYTLTSTEKNFRMMNIETSPVVEIENPVSCEYSICRSWLLPGLMKNLSLNKHRRYPQRIFELADCVLLNPKSETGADNKKKLAGIISHSKANLTEIISVLDAIRESLGIKWRIDNHNHKSFIPGRCGKILLNNRVIGLFGEMHPKVLVNFELKRLAVGFELDIEAVYKILGSRYK